LIVAGGIPARETARTKFQGFDIHICNIIYEEEVGKFLSKKIKYKIICIYLKYK
jgi:translation initiation factor 3 subunit I